MEKIPTTYDPVALTRILQGMQKQIEALQSTSIRRYKSVAQTSAQNLRVNEVGYSLDDSQNFDLLVRGEDSRLYRISGQASTTSAAPSSPAGVYVLKSGDTMTGLLILSGDPSAALGAATKQYADTKVADTGDTMTGALVIDGSADTIQLRVQGHSTQNSFLLVLEDSAGNDQVTVSNDGAVVINEEGNDADFRVESDTDANALYVDASANTVQVGSATTADSAKFYVAGKISLSGELEVNGDLNVDSTNIGFYGVTPVARAGATDDIKDALTTYGLLQGTSASPLNLDNGKLTCGEAEIDSDLNHDGANIGLNGAAPVAQSTGWAVTNVTTDKTFDANSTSIDEIADVLGTLIQYLISRGDIAA